MKRLLSLAVCTTLAALIGTAHAQNQTTNFTGPAEESVAPAAALCASSGFSVA